LKFSFAKNYIIEIIQKAKPIPVHSGKEFIAPMSIGTF